MMRRRGVSLGFFAVWCIPGISVGQDASSPDIVVTLNEGIYYYLEGQLDADSLAVAIERFTTVLQGQPDNTTALLFRALAHGRTALLRLDEKRSHQETVSLFKRILDIRADPDRLSRLEAEKVRAEAILASETAPLAEKNIALSLLQYYDILVEQIDRQEERTVEQLEIERGKAVQRSHTVARRERQQYLSMIADLNRLVQALDHPEAVIRLLEVVASAKVARIDEEEARDAVRGHISPSDASGPVKALRDAAATRLTEAADILEALLGDQLEQRSRVRTKFFLGVIRYRQGVPLRAESEPPGLDDRGRSVLQEAERLMAELADDAATDDAWRSYAALYLGIIIPFRAASETDAGIQNAILEEAERRLTQASEIDAQLEKRSNIPDLVRRQREVITELREAPPAAPQRNDLSLSLYAGARRDTNVVLLGERTDLPRDISQQRDFGFTAGASLDYTYDITQRLTLGLQARTSQLWNVEVHEFDQQTYGGSVALQREALREVDEFGPVYLALQYDFDYTLLGRSEFLRSHALTPSVRMYWAKQRAQTNVFFTYEVRDYSEPLFDRRFNRDGTYLTVGVSQRVKMMEMTAAYTDLGWEPWGLPGDEGLAQEDPDYPLRYMTPYLAASYSQDVTAGDEFDRRAAALLLGVEMPLPWGVEFDASALFEWERYPQGSLIDFHRRGRRDLVQEYGLALSRTFVLRAGNRANRYTPTFDRLLMTVRAHAMWTQDDSNVVDRFGQALFEYDRAVYGLSVAFAFN